MCVCVCLVVVVVSAEEKQVRLSRQSFLSFVVVVRRFLLFLSVSCSDHPNPIWSRTSLMMIVVKILRF